MIELQNNATKATVDPQGAWLAQLSDEKGDILFPRRSFTTPSGDTKLRGGCHVCLPNFGPGGQSGLTQHGFGRIVLWKRGESAQNEVTLLLEQGPGEYESLSSKLTYILSEMHLAVKLTLTNQGTTPLRVAPGFHPYFTVSKGTNTITANQTAHTLNELAETRFINTEAVALEGAARHLSLTSWALPTWALWTDLLGSYICVEPTVDGFSFLEQAATPAETLAAGASQTYQFEARWS